MNPSPFTNTGRKLVTFAVLGTGTLVGLQITALGQSGARAHGETGVGGEGLLQPAVSGMVRDAAGAPQIGTLVELLSPSLAVIAQTFTDDRGRYALPAVTPGTYEVKASGSFFLPTLRENLRLLANSRLVVNLTLNTLYQAIQWLPAQNRSGDEPKDDWNWTLRLSTNRPLLRVLEDDNGAGPMILVSDGSGDSAEDRRVTVRSGSNRFGEGGMHQDVEVERDHDDARQLILRTDVGQTDSATIRSTAAYLRQLGPGTAMLTVASYSDRPDVLAGSESGLQVFTLRSAATMAFGPDVEAEVGSELEAVHLGQTLAASHPFANLTVRDGHTTVRLRTASSPDVEEAADLDRDSTLAPRISQRAGALRFEQGSHQQIAVEHRFAEGEANHWTTTLAYFHDSVAHPLVGGGVAILNGRPALAAADIDSGDLLYDPATQLIAVSGESYAGSGLLAIARDQLTPETWVSVRYAVGQALAMKLAQQDGGQGGAAANPGPQTLEEALGGLRPHTSPMLAASIGSTVQHTHTALRASYRWQPSDTLTQVAPFDASAPEAYLSFHMRQPIQMHYRAIHGMQAIVDVRNLLAQGYRPFFSQDGSTLYFAQAERCVEGGLSFSF